MPIRFQVDPDFYDHPKTTGMTDAAFALWVRAGSFSAAKASDGFVADYVVTDTLRSDKSVAAELVRRRLWKRVRGGYLFHEWDGRNLTRARVEAERKADRERKAAGRREAAAQLNGHLVRPESNRSPPVSVSVSESVSVSVSGRAAAPSVPPPRTCLDHANDPNPPKCMRCRDARLAAETWEADRRARIRALPRCGFHPDQIAENCGACRADSLAADVA